MQTSRFTNILNWSLRSKSSIQLPNVPENIAEKPNTMDSVRSNTRIRRFGPILMSLCLGNRIVESRMKQPTFVGDSLLKALIFCLYDLYIRDG